MFNGYGNQGAAVWSLLVIATCVGGGRAAVVVAAA